MTLTDSLNETVGTVTRFRLLHVGPGVSKSANPRSPPAPPPTHEEPLAPGGPGGPGKPSRPSRPSLPSRPILSLMFERWLERDLKLIYLKIPRRLGLLSVLVWTEEIEPSCFEIDPL